MKRLIICSNVAFICAAAAVFAQASVNQEPHHKRLLYTNDLRMFDVTIPPGQAAGDHVHEYDMVTVVIGDGTARIQLNGADVAFPDANRRVFFGEHTGAPGTYRVENAETRDYHSLEVENLREGGGWPASQPLTAPGTSVVRDTRAFTVYDVQLTAGTDVGRALSGPPGISQTMHAHPWPTVVILVDGAMENGGIGGEEPVRLQKAGQWMFLPRGLSHTVGAIDGRGAHVVEIEVR